MSAFSNTPPQAVLPLGAYDREELERCAVRADQRLLRADLAGCTNKSEVLAELGRAFELPEHYGANLDVLYGCVTDREPLPEAEQPGFVVILEHVPNGDRFPVDDRDALLDVFRDAADFYFDRETAFRVFYSVAGKS